MIRTLATVLVALAVPFAAFAQEAPDQLVKRTTDEVLAIIKNDKDRITITQSAVVLEKLIGQFLFSKAQDDAGAKK